MFKKEIIINKHRIIFNKNTSHSKMIKRFEKWVKKWNTEIGFIILEEGKILWEEIVASKSNLEK